MLINYKLFNCFGLINFIEVVIIQEYKLVTNTYKLPCTKLLVILGLYKKKFKLKITEIFRSKVSKENPNEEEPLSF